ncbi:MAG: site-2 protease family protein [Candidatus Eisenbacteria bacterium]|uniref:Site-2 protease family protein n=1 Tax=Eiseniibacteriota bacterium TaxID=2212470 RepID=A0A948RXY2_UNCEI|nr:site-2 protease family protein [Candidatus Eisenbacteria bacterium]MBU1950304.1 site-2 protease family protein [Candidatus Eisenbacteria bacterium]MBU2692880.1 site-2 protease family protein [Candidatus Eisenbacteria bacterium]
MESIGLGVAWYVILILSLTFHEAAHALAAKQGGDLTAYHGGQVTLDPIPHIRRAPIGTILIPIISYAAAGWMIGWASTPYDPYWAQRYPRRAALMSLAGPAANLFLVLIAALAIRMGVGGGLFEAPDRIIFTQVTTAVSTGGWQGAATLLSILFSLNLILFVFNLIPVPPLDGSGVPPLFLSDESASKYLHITRQPGLSFLGFLIAWQLFNPVFRPIHLFAINLLYPGAHYG